MEIMEMIAETLILNELADGPKTFRDICASRPDIEEFVFEMSLNTLLATGKIAYNTSAEEYCIIPGA